MVGDSEGRGGDRYFWRRLPRGGKDSAVGGGGSGGAGEGTLRFVPFMEDRMTQMPNEMIKIQRVIVESGIKTRCEKVPIHSVVVLLTSKSPARTSSPKIN